MSRSYKNTVIAVLLACILTMAIGYAVLNTRLSISGTSKITSDFNIQVTGIGEFAKEGLAETANMSFTPTSATYSTNLQAAGDYVLYEIIIENKGTLPGYIYFDTNDDGYNDYGYGYEGNLEVGVNYVSRVPADVNDFFNWDNEIAQYSYLKPGDKLYVYASSYFNYSATEIPADKSFTYTINFNFYTQEEFSDSDLLVYEYLSTALLSNNSIVTSGTGLYYENFYNVDNDRYEDKYIFKSDSVSNVNNYVSIDGILWRIVNFTLDGGSGAETYILIQDEQTINKSPTGFSTVVDDNGYYNDFYNSDLLDYIYSSIYKEDVYDSINSAYYLSQKYNYILDTKLFNKEFENGTEVEALLNIEYILNASSEENCTISNLSTGGCKSWLTNNGDTYLANKIYSDETTNTGNIAYLQNGKVISVDPTNTVNYGYYKVKMPISSSCDFYVINSDNSDGSREKPYILDYQYFCPLPS